MGYGPEVDSILATMPSAERVSAAAILDKAENINKSVAAIDARMRRLVESRASQSLPARPSAGQGGLLRGMKPTTAIVGAVAVGALAYGAFKLMQRPEPAPQNAWSQRIEHERAMAAQQSAQRGI